MLEYPLNNNDKSIIEQTHFKEIKALKLKGGLPIFTAIRTDKPTQGEVYLYNLSGTYRICAYIDGVEKYVNLT